MKKLLSLSLLLVLLLLSGCSTPAPDNTDLEELELQLQETQAQLDEVQSYLDRMVWQGYLLPEDNDQILANNNLQVSRLSYEYMLSLSNESEYLDKTKFPAYIFDEFEEYIKANKVCNDLSLKYIGTSANCTIGFQFKIQLSKPDDMSNEDFIVRVSMMILELSEYDFYTIDSPELYIEFYAGGSSYMKVRMSLLVTDKYVLHPAIFWNGLMDTRIYNFTYDETQLQDIYQGYVDTLYFDGYVLPNYK